MMMKGSHHHHHHCLRHHRCHYHHHCHCLLHYLHSQIGQDHRAQFTVVEGGLDEGKEELVEEEEEEAEVKAKKMRGEQTGEEGAEVGGEEGMEVGGEWVEKEEVRATQERQRQGKVVRQSAEIITYHMIIHPVCIHRRRGSRCLEVECCRNGH